MKNNSDTGAVPRAVSEPLAAVALATPQLF